MGILSKIVPGVTGRNVSLYGWPMLATGINPDGEAQPVAVDADGKVMLDGSITVPDGVPILPKQAFVNAMAKMLGQWNTPVFDFSSCGITSLTKSGNINVQYLILAFYTLYGQDYTYDFASNAMENADRVNELMQMLIYAGVTNSTINLNGGTNAMLSDDNTNLVVLINSGNTVNYNGSIPVNAVAPSISGAYIGVACVCDPGAWSDFPSDYAYQWRISDDGVSGWTSKTGETTDTYVLVSDDEGKYIACDVTATNGAGTSDPVTSNVSDAVSEPSFPSGAVAYWRMEESSGTRVDATGNGNDLTEMGSMSNAAGLINNGASLDGSGSQKLTNTAMEIGSTYSTSMWFNVTDGTSNGEYPVALNFGLTDGSAGGIVLGDHNANNGWYYIGDGSTNIGQFQSCPYGEWYHVVVVTTPTNVKYYVDGTLRGQSSGSYDLSWTGLTIGNTNAGNGAIKGLIDEVGIWDRQLSEGEVGILYNGGAGLPLP